MRALQSALLGVLMLSIANRSHAQSTTATAGALTLSVGATTSRGSNFADRSAAAAAFAVERTLVARGHLALVGGMQAMMNHHIGSELGCAEGPNPCASPEPDILSLAIPVGARLQASMAQVDARIGPDLYAAQSTSTKSSGVGVIWGIAGTLRVTEHLGFSYAQDTHVVRLSGDRMRIVARLVGVRVAW